MLIPYENGIEYTLCLFPANLVVRAVYSEMVPLILHRPESHHMWFRVVRRAHGLEDVLGIASIVVSELKFGESWRMGLSRHLRGMELVSDQSTGNIGVGTSVEHP